MADEKKIGIGIDLGTTNLLVYVQGHGIIFDEPSVVAFDIETGQVIAGGAEAFAMIGKTHNKIRVSRPLKDGVISDMDAAKALLKYVFKRVESLRSLRNTLCLICCPSEVTPIEREALKELSLQMGITDAFIEEEIKAGAIGSGIDIYSPEAAMVIDIGGGTTDVGVLSLGDVVLSRSIRVAGNYIDQEIANHVHRRHNLLIGPISAEKVKKEIATLIPNDKERTVRVSGRDIIRGLPSAATISSKEVFELLLPIFDELTNVVYTVLEQTPPELASDIVRKGIIIEGGGALIPGVKEYFEKTLGLKVRIASEPLNGVVEGAKVLLKNRGSYLVNPQN